MGEGVDILQYFQDIGLTKDDTTASKSETIVWNYPNTKVGMMNIFRMIYKTTRQETAQFKTKQFIKSDGKGQG